MLKRVLDTSTYERRLWGRMVRGYERAFGTGHHITDPEAIKVGGDGHLWMMEPIEKWEVFDIWEQSGMNRTDPQSAYPTIEDCEDFKVHLTALKFEKSQPNESFWACLIRINLDRDEVVVGWFGAPDILEVFTKYDEWKEPGLALRMSLDEITY